MYLKSDHFNDIHYHKYHHHHHLQIPCQSVSMAARWHQTFLSCAFLKSEWRPISVVQDHFPCSESLVHIVLWRSFSLYHSVSGFLIAARRSSFGEALATWPNKYHWFRWLMSPDKNTSLEWHLLVQIAILLKVSNLFKNASSSNWEICISNNNKNIHDF